MLPGINSEDDGATISGVRIDNINIPIFKEVAFDSTEDFLAALLTRNTDRAHILWHRGDEHDWIFRGQAEAFWKLTPAVFRDVSTLPFHILYDKPVAMDAVSQIAFESDLVMSFASACSRVGIEVPGDRWELRDHDQAPPKEDVRVNFPHGSYHGMYALAQHAGVPTRFLDWTFSPLIAAYFAAVEAARWLREQRMKHPQSDGRLAIWAIQREFVNADCRKLRPASAAIVTVPGASNPNLRAQEGIFTLVRFKDCDPGETRLPELDDLAKLPEAETIARNREGAPLATMLYKLTVPQSEAPWLLYRLHRLGVDAATLFPGHEGVARMLRERKFMQERG